MGNKRDKRTIMKTIKNANRVKDDILEGKKQELNNNLMIIHEKNKFEN
jgi:hypothetical protein